MLSERQIYKEYQSGRTFIVDQWGGRESDLLRPQIRQALKVMRIHRTTLKTIHEWNW